MAIKDYLAKDTYSVVDSITFSKRGWLRFDLKIFSDSSKSVELATKTFEISRHILCKGIKGFTSVPPKDAMAGEFYVVLKDPKPTGEWEGREGLFAVLNEKGQWCFWGSSGTETLYNIVDDYYFKLNLDTLEPVKIMVYNDIRLWDKWFSSELVFSDSSNIHKQIYSFLKSHAGFENVIDA